MLLNSFVRSEAFLSEKQLCVFLHVVGLFLKYDKDSHQKCILLIEVDEQHNGLRLDHYLAEAHEAFSRSLAKRFIDIGGVHLPVAGCAALVRLLPPVKVLRSL